MAETNKNNAEYVSTGKPLATGAVFAKKLATGASFPTSLSEISTWPCLGYISEDGIENGLDTSVTDHKVWGGDIVMSSLDEFKETYGFSMVETKPDTMKVLWGENAVTGTDYTNMTVDHGSEGFETERCFVIVTLYRDKACEMHVIPRGKLSNIDSVSSTDSDLLAYPVEITARAGAYSDNPKCTSRHYFFAQTDSNSGSGN